ncbi:MAG TPA: hypothetical protein PKA33_20320 [Amaricoccus sp.]|mgnify:CR=1 FL=1|uniref:hypothetical protein n=1 Tax=Amaricoccus sp. TaxID=1872485 RepID=UPI002C5C4DC6|nr:hypothetical protein [Amaricoccus sp.]HMQ94372.1 hypothetical protein [Amaricoccus sp.]HMR54636.1 hypothetical protein [Amaricoccus sp.]HMR62316.1 hypothetical protein [Amaricoccus sp.]HMU01679.1 hypothetical protein [Amaricoccus sp.]
MRATAAARTEKREQDLARPGELEGMPVGETRRRDVAPGDAIAGYGEDGAKAIGRTRAPDLESIKAFDIAPKRCTGIAAVATEKPNAGVAPETLAKDPASPGRDGSKRKDAPGPSLGDRKDCRSCMRSGAGPITQSRSSMPNRCFREIRL